MAGQRRNACRPRAARGWNATQNSRVGVYDIDHCRRRALISAQLASLTTRAAPWCAAAQPAPRCCCEPPAPRPHAHTPRARPPTRRPPPPLAGFVRLLHPSVSGSRSPPRRPAPSRRAARLSPRCPRRAVGGRGDAEAHQLAQGRPRHLDREHRGRSDPQHPRPGVGAGPIYPALRSAARGCAAVRPPGPAACTRLAQPRPHPAAAAAQTTSTASHITAIAAKARSVIRDLDPTNDLTFLRLRSKKHEIMVAPGARPKPAPLRGLRAARGRAAAPAAEPEAEQVLRGNGWAS